MWYLLKKAFSWYVCLKDSKALGGDPAELIREWRGEWTNPWEDSI
jgi:hypothetical protein